MGSPKDRASGMKSAYERALERLDAEGIERPREEALSAKTKSDIAEIRRTAEAKTAELEILHRDSLKKLQAAGDATRIEEQEEFFRRERERIQSDADRKVAALKQRD